MGFGVGHDAFIFRIPLVTDISNLALRLYLIAMVVRILGVANVNVSQVTGLRFSDYSPLACFLSPRLNFYGKGYIRLLVRFSDTDATPEIEHIAHGRLLGVFGD